MRRRALILRKEKAKGKRSEERDLILEMERR